MVNIERLSGIVPAHILKKIPDIKQINGPLRLCHFLSQCAHESLGFRVVEENLNYGELALIRNFPLYFNNQNAFKYARNPENIANKIYANRMGNGDEASGDGWKYRGRGYIQLTGKDNYKLFSDYIGVDCVDLVATKYPLESAAWFFDSNGLWKICDEGADFKTVKKLTKRINGGLTGIEDRKNLFYKYYEAITK